MVVTHTAFQVLTSKLARTEDPITMHLYTGWVGTLLASVALPFVWTALPAGSLWGWLSARESRVLSQFNVRPAAS